MFSKSVSRSSRYVTEQDEDWIEPKKPRRDWKKVFLVLGLGSLSWVATYVGMLELIQANIGALDFTTKIVVGFSVAIGVAEIHHVGAVRCDGTVLHREG